MRRFLSHLLAHIPARLQGVTPEQRLYRINQTMSNRQWLRQYEKARK